MALDERYRTKLEQVLADIVDRSEASGKRSLFCVGTTMNIGNDEYFFSSLREGSCCISGNIMISHTRDLGELVAMIDGKVDEILIDVEKKKATCRDMEDIIRSTAKKSRVGYFRGNSVTAEAFEYFFALYCRKRGLDFRGRKACVIGAGHLGIKIASILCEYGMDVDLTGTDQDRTEKVAQAVNAFTARGSAVRAVAVPPGPGRGPYLVITGVTNGIAAVTAAMLEDLEPDGLVIDAGLGTVTDEALVLAAGKNIPVLCLMSQSAYAGMMAGYHHTLQVVDTVCRRKLEEGFSLVSGGMIGDNGDVIVDNAHSPTRVIAVARGNGLVLTGEEKEKFSDRIKLVEDKYLVEVEI